MRWCDNHQLHLLATVDGGPVGTVSYPRLVPENRLAELGYWMDPDHHREGYGTEAVELLVGHGFAELGLHRIAARVFGFNDASRGLLEKVGFTQEGQHRDVRYLDGEWHDEHWYSVLESEWRGRTIQ